MTQRRWSTTEVSAYLDGQLEPKRQAALEADMEHNVALRRRIEEMQHVVSLLRAEPLREPPRNYLLTSSMVAEATPRTTKSAKRTPLLVLRLATSMVTLAFVITFGLTALQGNLIPGMQARSSAAPEAVMMDQPVEPAESDDALSVMVMPEVLTDKDDLEMPAEEGEPEMLLAPLPEAAGEEDEVERATAVESAEPEMSVMTETDPGDEVVIDDVEAAALEEPLPSDRVDLQREPSPEADAAIEDGEQFLAEDPGEVTGEDVPTSPVEDSVMVVGLDEGGLSPWISRGLGIAAVILAAVTFWLTYQPLSRRK